MDSCWPLLFLSALNLCFCSSGAAGVFAVPGEDSVLPCEYDIKRDVSELWWTRLDQSLRLLQVKDGEVTLWNKNYTERMFLVDPELKRGNYSLVLRNVTKEDSGIYECKAMFFDEHSASAETYSFSFRVAKPEPRSSGSSLQLFVPALMFSLLMAIISL